MASIANAVASAKELVRRQKDGLTMYRSLDPKLDPDFADQTGLFECQASEILIGGGNRAGKSINAAVMLASIARDIPVTTWDGRQIECRRPWQKGKELQIWIIGLKINHFSTIYRLLFRAGVYRIIQDDDTGLWRSWRPWEDADLERQNETKPSWPLIPNTQIDPKSWSYESAAKKEFTHVRIPGKAEIWCFPSSAREPRQGEAVDVIWIDEAIEFPEHYVEWQMRLSDRSGRIFWSSWPRRGNDALNSLKERSEEQAIELERGDRDSVDCAMFTYVFENNPFIPKDEKRKRKEGMSEEEWRARNFGEFLTDNSKIYPFFDKNIHCAIPYDSNLDDDVAKVLRANGGIPPANWTHELVLDPGTAKPCVLMAAIPPPELWVGTKPFYVIYREIYKGRMTAWEIAEQIFRWTPRGVAFNRWVIDNQAGRRIPEGHRESIATNYELRFLENDIQCLNRGPSAGFHIGNPEFPIRREMVEHALKVGPSGYPQLRIVNEHCPQTAYQMANNQLAMQSDFVLERANEREKNDCRVCVEYWIASSPTHVPPESYRGEYKSPSSELKLFMEQLQSGPNTDSGKGKGIRIGPGAIAS